MLLIEIHTAGRCYMAPQAHVDRLMQLTQGATPEADVRGRPLLCRELGPLLAPEDTSLPGRRHALTVILRRRTVALLVERVERLTTPGSVYALSPIVLCRLNRPWILGAITVEDQPMLVLDLRRIATDVALGVV